MHRRVLVADSHLEMLRGVHSLIESVCDSIVMVADERSLIDVLDVLQPALVIIDLSLPNAEQGDLARRLMAAHPELVIIVLSVHDESAVVRQMFSAGIAGYVLKQSAVSELAPAVEAVLTGGRYVSSAVVSDAAVSTPPRTSTGRTSAR